MADKAEKGKKRKREIDGSSKPSKKIAVEGNKNIKISFQDAGKWAPVIASTPGMSLPEVPLKAYSRPRRNAPPRAPQIGTIATTELLLHSSAHSRLDFTGKEEEAGGVDALLKHYVGVYDPATGKLEVMEARRMVVRGSVRARQATIEDEVSTNMRELRNNLGQTFGTKKAKKAIASVTENAIGPARNLTNGQKPAKLKASDAAILDSMKEATSGMATRDQLEEEADASKPIPKPNRSATDIREVYTIASLIGTDIFKHIPVLDWQKDAKAKKNIKLNSRYVANRLQGLAENTEKLKILQYLYLLLELYRVSKPVRSSRLLPKRDELRTVLGNMPEVLVESIKRQFSDAGQMSKFKIDLLITHICALACLVGNYEVDMYDLKEDLRIDLRDMAKYFTEIGAKIFALPEAMRKDLQLDKAAAAQRKVARLRLPLEFPKLPYGKKPR